MTSGHTLYFVTSSSTSARVQPAFSSRISALPNTTSRHTCGWRKRQEIPLETVSLTQSPRNGPPYLITTLLLKSVKFSLPRTVSNVMMVMYVLV